MHTKRISLFAVLLSVVALLTFSSAALTQEPEPPEDKAAVVNGSVITQADLDSQMSIFIDRMHRSGQFPDAAQLDQIRMQVLQVLISWELLYQDSQKKGIKISQEEIDQQFTKVKGQFPSEVEFMQWLNRMKLTEAGLKEKLGRDLALRRLMEDQIATNVTVSDSEIRAYYENNPEAFRKPERVKASHILIKVDPEADALQKAEAQKKIEVVQQKLKKGEDFSALAKEYSEGPTGPKGGDLGYFTRGQMVKPFEDAAFAMKPGEVSNKVETRFGYHLIKVTEKETESKVPYEEVKERLGQFLKQRKVQQEMNVYVKNLEDKAEIERFDNK